MPFNDSRVFAGDLQATDPRQVALGFQQLAGFIDNPIADVKCTPDTVTTSPRLVVVQARDRLAAPWAARWLVLLVFGDTEWNVSGTQTVTPVSGSIVVEVVPGQVLLCITDADGSLSFTIDAVAARFVTAVFLGRAQSSGSVALT